MRLKVLGAVALATILAGSSTLVAQRRLARGRAGAAEAPAKMTPVSNKLLTDSGGRVAWYKGDKHDLIAFDAVSNQRTQDTDIYVIRPDGTGRRCVTCSSNLPKGFKGQMDWHPDGQHLVTLAENSNSDHKPYNHPAWGVDNDLWLVDYETGKGEKIWSPKVRGGGALHPHFNHAGTVIVFAERMPTGKQLPRILRFSGPQGESQWEGWGLHIADFDIRKPAAQMMSNDRLIQPNGPGLYEPNSITEDGRIVYAYTPNGENYVDDVYVVGMDGRNPKNLTNSPWSWDEHGHYSPDGRYFAFMSSRGDTGLRFPRAKARDLTTELYIQDRGGEPVQVTNANEMKGRKSVVSRFDWSRDSKRIVYQIAVLDQSDNPELWILTLP